MMKKIILGVFLSLTIAATTFAGNVQTFGIGAKATALGEAVSAHSDDPFATYYNPAGLTLTKTKTISVGGIYYDPVIDISDFKVVSTTGATSGMDLNSLNGRPSSFSSNESDDNTFMPQIGFAMPVTDKLFFGIATYAPYGLHVTWDKNPANSPGSSYAWESYYGRQVVTPTLAYKLSDKLSAGFGISIGKSISEAGKTYDYNDALKDASTYTAVGYSPADAAAAAMGITMMDDAQLKMEATDDANYSFNFGLMYEPSDNISLGFTYRGRTKTDFSGDLTINNATNPLTSESMNIGGSVSMEYDHPESLQTGIRYSDNKKFSAEFDLTWTRWSILENQVEKAHLDFDSSVLAALSTLPAETQDSIINPVFFHDRAWEDTLQYKLGFEYYLTNAVTLRLGYTYDPTPVPDDTFEFGWPDTDRSVYNIGCGWVINESWTLDTTIQYVNSSPVRSVDGDSDELNAAYTANYGTPVNVYLKDEGTLFGYSATLTYNF